MDNTDSFSEILPKPDLGFGSITMMIREVGEQSPEAQQELFVKVMDQLKRSARGVLRRFPKVRELDEDALVNEVYEHLLKKLLNKSIENRGHFFATACNYFRWTLLDLVKRKNLETELLFDEHLMTDHKPRQLEQAEFHNFAFAQLNQIRGDLRLIFESHVFLGMSFAEIAEIFEMPKSTAHDHFLKAKSKLRQLISNP